MDGSASEETGCLTISDGFPEVVGNRRKSFHDDFPPARSLLYRERGGKSFVTGGVAGSRKYAADRRDMFVGRPLRAFAAATHSAMPTLRLFAVNKHALSMRKRRF